MQGFRGRANNCISLARNKVEKALQYAYRDRRNKKRDMRALWIQRINAGSKQHGVSLACTAWPPLLQQPSAWQGDMHATSWPLRITRLNAHVQVPYSRLMHGLAQENIRVNRKVLSELAMNEPHSFKALVDQVCPILHEPASLSRLISTDVRIATCS